MDIGKICCCRKTCPNYEMVHQEGSSSRKSSVADCFDKQTQKTLTDISSEAAIGHSGRQSAETSETNIDRNNENLKTPQLPSCPICARQFQQTYRHLYRPKASHPLINESNSCSQKTCASHNMNIPMPTREQTTCLFQHPSLELSSSSNSSTSEQIPIGLILNIKNNPEKSTNPPEHIVVPLSLLRSQCQEFIKCEKSITAEEEEYYSCNSDCSSSDASFQESIVGSKIRKYSKKSKKQNRTLAAALQLLDMVVQQVTENTARENDRKPPPLNRSFVDECICTETKISTHSAEQRHSIASEPTNEKLVNNNSEDVTTKGTSEPRHFQFLPPTYPYVCYCVPLNSSNQHLVTIPIIPGQYPYAFFPPNTAGDSGSLKQEENVSISDIRQYSPKQNESKVEVICLCSEGTEICPKHGLNKELETEHRINNEDKKTEAVNSSQIPPEEESFHKIFENHEEELTKFAMSYDKEETEPPEKIKLKMEEPPNSEIYPEYEEEISPYNLIQENTNVESAKLGSHQMLDTIQLPAPHDSQYLREWDNDANLKYDFSDNSCEELNEEGELEKETQAERQKNRDHKDPCNCCHCQAIRQSEDNKCTTLATRGNVSGVDEFKYFIDSIIMDMEAMEHTRRKCDALKNLCMPRPGVCSRESFPVTITDVEELGTTSLYVKWIIHDCYGIGGYEIFIDGYLTNRYYHSGHTSGVVTDIDVTIPHKVAIVAQANAMEDYSLETLCQSSKPNNRCKSLPWKTKVSNNPKSTHQIASVSLWTPSIYLYDPAGNKTLPVLPKLDAWS